MAEGVEIKDLQAATSVADDDILLIQQEGTTKKVDFETLRKKSAEEAISENNLVDEEQLTDAVAVVSDDLDAVKAKLPSTASADNQLADKDFVNSSIATNTAHYISNNGVEFNSVEELEAYSGAVTPNDYAFVKGTDDGGNAYYDRYKASVTLGVVTWAKEYRLNNSSFTAAQWAAIQSGITAELVALIGQASGSSPIGTILSYMGENIPAGFLLCDGRELLIANYEKLYAVIGQLPSCQSENEGYFKLPDLRNKFLEGAENNLGESIEAGIPNITGTFDAIRTVDGASNISGAFSRTSVDSTGTPLGRNNSNFAFKGIDKFNASKGETKTDGTIKTTDDAHVYGNSDTVQPPAVTVNYIIKATSTNEALDEVIDDSTCDTGHAWSGEKVKTEIDAKGVYSTEETVVGTWIDGKPIYRKVISFEFTSNVSKTFTIDTSIDVGFINNSMSYVYGVYGHRQPWNITTMYIDKGGILAFTTTHSAGTAILTLEYTKTTD